MSADDLKRAAAEAALSYVENDMCVGLGTGSTAAHFIDLLGAKARDGLFITGVATSEETRAQAVAAGIDVIVPDEATRISVAVDGADEVDGDLNLIKGGGAALLREKIVANAAEKFVVIAHHSKCVSQLGAFPLPVEIEPAHWALTVTAVRDCLKVAGYDAEVALRGAAGQPATLTDGGHYVLDCQLARIEDASHLDDALRAIPGVIETGLFIGMADLAIIAGEDGIETLMRS